MTRFVLGRITRMLAVLLFASILVFSTIYLTPGTPLSVLSGGRTLTPDQVAALTAQYHLDDPLYLRYWNWLIAVLHGDLGASLISRESVGSLIADRIGTTILLVGYASLIIVVVGLSVGIVAALRGGWVDTGIVALTAALAAIPSFVAAGVLVTVFAVNRSWFPPFGEGTGFADRIWHLTLPAIALALAALGFAARVTRTSVLDEKGREHVTVARGRGLPERRVIRRHVLRNAMIPVTVAVGITVAGLIAGSVVVEQAFALNGIGTLLIQAVVSHDYAVVQAVTLILVAAFIIVNTIVDMTLPLLDPRIQLGRQP